MGYLNILLLFYSSIIYSSESQIILGSFSSKWPASSSISFANVPFPITDRIQCVAICQSQEDCKAIAMKNNSCFLNKESGGLVLSPNDPDIFHQIQEGEKLIN